MKSSLLRIFFVLIICSIFPGLISQASKYLPISEADKYRVTFGESYVDFLPGSLLRIEVIFRNNTANNLQVSQELAVLDSTNTKVWRTIINLSLAPEDSSTIQLMVPVPKFPGCYTLTPGKTSDQSSGIFTRHIFNVIQPKRSPRLEKILVHTPDSEVALTAFLKTWNIKAPTFSWAQVLLCGKTSWRRFAAGDQQITQLISRALRREMSVIFLDFGPIESPGISESPVVLPFGPTVRFMQVKLPGTSFVLKSGLRELSYSLASGTITKWNGLDGITVPPVEMQFEGKEVKISALATAGGSPVRYPLVEMIPQKGKGKVYLCQLITEGRLDEELQQPRYKPQVSAYDPCAVQLLLNLISASVGDNLLK